MTAMSTKLVPDKWKTVVYGIQFQFSALSQRHALTWVPMARGLKDVQMKLRSRFHHPDEPVYTLRLLVRGVTCLQHLAAKVDAIEGHRKVGWRRFCV